MNATSNSTHDIWHVDYTRKRMEQAAQGWKSIGLVFAVNSCMFIVACLLFRVARSSRTSLFFMGTANSNYEAYPFNVPMTTWARFVAFLKSSVDVETLHRDVGDEGAFYLTFQIYALKMLLAMSLFAIVFLIPTYIASATTPIYAFSTMTIRALPNKSPLLWIPVASCYVFSLFYAIFLNRLSRLCHNKDPTQTNLLCMLPTELSAKTVLVDAGAPLSMSQERIFYLLDQIFPGYVAHVTVVYDLGEYKCNYSKRLAMENSIERLNILLARKYQGKLRWYSHLFHAPFSFLSSIPMSGQIMTLQTDIDKLHQAEVVSLNRILTTHRGTGRIFVIFKDAKSKAKFVRKTTRRSLNHFLALVPERDQITLRQKVKELRLTSWHLVLAPEPDDLDWHFISYHRAKRTAQTVFLYTFLTVFIILFTSPLAVTSAISAGSYSGTAKSVNDLVYQTKVWVANMSPAMANMTFSYIPTMILVMINAVLLNVILHAGRMQPKSTDSDKEKSILRYSALYLIFNTLIVPSFTFVSISSLIQHFMNQGQVLEIFEMLFLNNSGVFFVNYVIQRAFIGSAVVALRLSEAAQMFGKVCRAVTPAEHQKAVEPWKFYTGTQSALQISVLVVIFSFSTVVPVILPFGAFYFFMQHLVDKYSLLYVRPKIKGKGTIAKTSTHASMLALLIYQTAMAGFFIVRGTTHQIIAVVVLVLVSSLLVMWNYIRDKEQLYRAVGKAYAPEQTVLLSPTSKSVDMYRDPILRLLEPTSKTQSERYGSMGVL
ncbi:hypothetical protein Ae201684P_018799 [Aphanomyces euteiches]|uniref:CSC1/OSCA1-like 7TM region domain-containing protein n=1 Tax=Aphanomyces euteiches TaxID=100861 RepID=A0A6G0XUQ8_9STRA|nr:hypothetical protein Ae201684_000882 [Aphanomyces euteiches]KAH9099789.1 hypothetical protein Ae201684P_018799 [Aphanomyces euteiches]KAH9140634.1 hypothetical protein AeRB84_015134 [Aphanomyces euteiches]KAH9148751.1 hypothetical protein AeRB84_008001 [Aphanomyces euteiches]KAH9150714.1 hypothetical protein AeRB84_006500 [Aphanomyces euteiches]